MTKPELRTPRKFSQLIAAAILDYNNGFDLDSAGRPLARALAALRDFSYARHDPRRSVKKRRRQDIVTPEIRAYSSALVLCGWVAWVHCAKGLWHFNEISVGGEVFLNHEFVPNVMRAIAVGRSKALLDKIREGHFHPEFRVNDAINLLEKSIN